MSFSNQTLEQTLLETAAGQAVYDALVQANVNLQTVSLELVKQMLIAECRYRRQLGFVDCDRLLTV
ncbi:MAG: hypothetical protein KDA89_21845 [Planctomycetaceae bacterium]|nr:hypothetical protein [Planctomycetaceae bacterium]